MQGRNMHIGISCFYPLVFFAPESPGNTGYRHPIIQSLPVHLCYSTVALILFGEKAQSSLQLCRLLP